MTLTRFEWTRRARPVMEVGLGSSDIDDAAALWDVSLWDAPDSKWNGDEPLWRDVSCDVIDVHIEQGRGRVSDAYPVGNATVTVDNHTGWADPSTDDFELDSTVGYISLPGTADNYISVDDYAALGITGDICVVFRYRTAVWPPPAGTGWITAVRVADGVTTNDAWSVRTTGGGELQLTTFDGATSTAHVSDVLTPTTDWRWFAVALDVDNGAGGHTSKWFYGGTDDDAGTWVEYSTETAAGTLVISDVSSPLVIGYQGADGLVGDISHVSVRSGTGPGVTVGGTTVFEFNGWDLAAADVGATSITPRVGPNPMVVHRTGSDPITVTSAVDPFRALLKLRPGRPIRVGVSHSILGTRWLYRGFIDAIEPKDAPDDWSTVSLRCIDALGEAGRAKLAATDVESGAGEQARTRFARILNLIRWPASKRSISTSAIRTLYAAELDDQVVDMLRRTAESEGGWCFGDNQGRVVLKHRDWLYREQGGEVDATIGNVDTGIVMFAEDPPGSGLMIYLGDSGDWLEDAPDLMAWTGAP